MEDSQIEIIDFTDEFAPEFKKLNYDWIEKYFRIEKGDEISLSNPKLEILDRGGFIFCAKVDEKIVGVAALLKKSAADFELSKMAVSTEIRGKGIGKRLIEHCISFAKDHGISRLILYSNTQLAPAIHLYRKFGFEEIELEQGVYDRADIKMEKILNTG